MNLFIFYDFECYNDLCEIKERKRELDEACQSTEKEEGVI